MNDEPLLPREPDSCGASAEADSGRVAVPEVQGDDSARRELPRLVRFGAFEFTYLDGMRYVSRSHTKSDISYITDLEERECSCPAFQIRKGATYCTHFAALVAGIQRATRTPVE